MKDFKEHFFLLYNKLKNNENFAFSRFSDGKSAEKIYEVLKEVL